MRRKSLTLAATVALTAGVVFATGSAANASEWFSNPANCAQTYQRAKVTTTATAGYREHWRVDYVNTSYESWTLYATWTTSGTKTSYHGGGTQNAYAYSDGSLSSQSISCVAA